VDGDAAASWWEHRDRLSCGPAGEAVVVRMEANGRMFDVCGAAGGRALPAHRPEVEARMYG
jgi:hypothetical protein